MKNMIFQDVNRKSTKNMNALRQLTSTVVLGLCIGVGLPVSKVLADEHSMHDMSGMQDMQGMEHMDHSQHQQFMSERGTYSRTVMSYSIPDVKLVDENGKSVSLRDMTNGQAPVMLNFIFTTCTTICPVMTSTFHQVQEKLGKNRKNVRMVSISIDPENDTPKKLKAYASKNMADGQWTFLTGTLENVIQAQKAFGAFAGEKMNHKPITFLKGNGADAQWVRLEGLAEAGQVIDEYNQLAMKGMKHDMGGMKHDMSGMNHDMGQMKHE